MRTWLTLLLAAGISAQAQVFLPHRWAGGPASTGISPPLDVITNPPWAAWSVTRKLRTAYAGSAYKAVRMSDTNGQDIGFTAAGLVDTNALLAFAGTGTNAAYLGILYDQSGNARDMDWPQYTSVGWQLLAGVLASNSLVMVDENNRPVARMPGAVSSYIRPNNLIPIPNAPTNTYFVVSELYERNDANTIVSYGSSSDGALLQSTTSGDNTLAILNGTGSAVTGPIYRLNTQFLATVYFRTNGVDSVKANRGPLFTGEAGDRYSSWPEIGYNGGTVSAKSRFSEWLFWNAQPDTNSWAAAETNMMAFYSIGPPITNCLVELAAQPPAAYWKLDELSGDRADSQSTNTLYSTNVVGNAVGVIGNAGAFTNANAQALWAADGPDISAGNIDFTIALWVKMKSTNNAFSDVAIKGQSGVANAQEWELYYQKSDNKFHFQVSNGASISSTVASGVIALNTWYYLVCWHDAAANTINIQMNNAAPASLAWTTGSWDSTKKLSLGGDLVNATMYLTGEIDEVGFWRRVLLTCERTDLYNSGAGRTCCPFAP